MKNESWFLTKNNTSFDSEFDADSEYVYIFVKYFGKKNGLIDTCPFPSCHIIGYGQILGEDASQLQRNRNVVLQQLSMDEMTMIFTLEMKQHCYSKGLQIDHQ